jgi:cytochrome c biogenesis protein CcmG/thiol:disulfide interchange protein DsbE
MALDWGVYGVPETYVLDADGTIVLRFAGPITESVLENRIRPAIAEAGGAGG